MRMLDVGGRGPNRLERRRGPLGVNLLGRYLGPYLALHKFDNGAESGEGPRAHANTSTIRSHLNTGHRHIEVGCNGDRRAQSHFR